MNTVGQTTEERIAKDKMLRAKRVILESDPRDSLQSIIYRDRDAFSGLRLIYASEAAGTDISPFLPKPEWGLPVTGVFYTSRILFFSDKIERAMLSNDCQVSITTGVTLDTNFLSDLPRYFGGEVVERGGEIKRTLDYIMERLGGAFDWTFPALENLREVVQDTVPYPYIKVAAAKYFDETRNTAPRTGGFNEFDQNLERYFRQANDYWDDMLSTPGTWDALNARDLVYCLMLKATLERWSGASVELGLRNMVQFCASEIDVLAQKELYFAWKALQPDSRLAFLDESKLQRPHRKSLGRIKSLSWDIFLFRFIEALAADRSRSDFYLPQVSSFDQGLVEALKACPLRAVLVHDGCGYMESIFYDTPSFSRALDEAMTPEHHAHFSDPKRVIGAKAGSRVLMRRAIHSLERQVEEKIKEVV